MFPGYNVPRILSIQGPISPGSQVSKAWCSQRAYVFQLNILLTHINPPCVRVCSCTLRAKQRVSVDDTHSLKPHFYLLLGVQPREESFGVDELQPEVPSLTQADRPGNLRHRQKRRDMSTSTFTTSSSFILQHKAGQCKWQYQSEQAEKQLRRRVYLKAFITDFLSGTKVIRRILQRKRASYCWVVMSPFCTFGWLF